MRDYEAGIRVLNTANYQEAVSILWKAADRAAKLGETDERHIRTLFQLASALRNKPDYPEAESVAKRALKLAEKSLGRDALELANLLNLLAVLHDDQDRLVEAEPLYQRALAYTDQGSRSRTPGCGGQSSQHGHDPSRTEKVRRS